MKNLDLKTNNGLLFKNDKKADNHPDYKGQIDVNGVRFDLAGWVKTGAKGTYLSVKVSEPFVPANAPDVPSETSSTATQEPNSPPPSTTTDELPF